MLNTFKHYKRANAHFSQRVTYPQPSILVYGNQLQNIEFALELLKKNKKYSLILPPKTEVDPKLLMQVLSGADEVIHDVIKSIEMDNNRLCSVELENNVNFQEKFNLVIASLDIPFKRASSSNRNRC